MLYLHLDCPRRSSTGGEVTLDRMRKLVGIRYLCEWIVTLLLSKSYRLAPSLQIRSR